MVRDSRSNNFVELAPTRYQFAELVGDEYDDNWLMIRGHVQNGPDEWHFEDPSLLVEDATRMSMWLRRAGQGEVPVSLVDEDGEIWPQLSFLEPNLGFAVVARDSDRVTLRVFLSHESGKPDNVPHIVKSKTDAVVDLVVAPADLARAAEEWASAVEEFPERTPTNGAKPAD